MLTAQSIRERAFELGFDLIGFAPAGPAPGADAFLRWLAAGYAADMTYLAREPRRRADPRLVLPGARTVIMAGLSYDSLAVPEDVLSDPARGRIARYAWGADYHPIMQPRLRQLGDFVANQSRAYVDTGPVMEKSWAARCGLGFIGNNTCLIHPARGSYLFLGAVLVGEEIATEDDQPAAAGAPSEPGRRKASYGCGRCTRCLAACPTRAFPQPGVLDARRCISYLTIELKGSIPVELRPAMGNWIFGCDACQDVCPYVKRYTSPSAERAFYPVDVDRAAPKLLDVLRWDRAEFNRRFAGTALTRAKRRGLLRNACVAAGNWGNPAALPLFRALLADEEPVVREHAAWAMEQIECNR